MMGVKICIKATEIEVEKGVGMEHLNTIKILAGCWMLYIQILVTRETMRCVM